jgi:transposase
MVVMSASRNYLSFRRVACHDCAMGANAELLRLMEPQLRLGLPVLDEKSRRLVLGMVARAAGDGGTGAVAKMTGASWQTVADGAAELESGRSAPQGRVRRPGAGRKKLAETDPGLVPALVALVSDSTRGDPESPLVWTTKSVRHLSDALAGQGHRCSPQTVWRLLHEQGFSTQANAKVMEGKQHPDRDAQFRYIAAQAKEHLAARQPVISVDAKKKEPAPRGALPYSQPSWEEFGGRFLGLMAYLGPKGRPGTIACQESSGRVQVRGAGCCGTRAIR